MEAVLDLENQVLEENRQDIRLAGIDVDSPVYGFTDGSDSSWDWVSDLEANWEFEGEEQTLLTPEDLAFLRDVNRVGFDLWSMRI